MVRRFDVRTALSALLATNVLGAALAGACSSDDSSSSGATQSSTGSGTGTGLSGAGGSLGVGGAGGGTGGVKSDYPCTGCAPFPPIGAPECDPKTLGPPTVSYPVNGILLPPNMNVLEVQFVPPAGATLFEADFTNGITEVKVETKCNQVPDVRGGASKGCGITLPQGAWNDIANTNRDGDPVVVTVRATIDGKCVATSKDKIDILFAKEDLAGGIYYWQSAVYGGIGGKTGGIYSHDFGSFDPTPTPFLEASTSGTCVGCHNLSRDGIRISVESDDPDADDEMGDVKTHILDVATRTPIGNATVSPGFQTFTHDHTEMVSSTYKTHMNAAFDVFNGDTGASVTSMMLSAIKATQPDLSKDDKTLVYVVPQAGTIPNKGDHHFMGGALYSSTFDPSSNALGAPTALLTPTGTVNYYYPAMSPNQTFLVFNEAPDGDCFWNRKARVKLLHYPPGANPTPVDLPALNLTSSVANSWPRWSPFVQTYKNHKLLWVTFSSNRDYGLHLSNKGFDNCYPPESPMYDQPQPLSKQGVGYESCAQPQIWMAAILVDDDPSLDAKDRSFPSFWLPFQDVNSHNFSAQWVEKIATMGGDAGTDGGNCGMTGAACGTNQPCCANVVCCSGSCKDLSSCVN